MIKGVIFAKNKYRILSSFFFTETSERLNVWRLVETLRSSNVVSTIVNLQEKIFIVEHLSFEHLTVRWKGSLFRINSVHEIKVPRVMEYLRYSEFIILNYTCILQTSNPILFFMNSYSLNIKVIVAQIIFKLNLLH